MRRAFVSACFAFVALASADADDAGGGRWKTPGEIKQPRGTWQVPGQIQQPKGPWKQPGEVAVPKEIETVEIRDRSSCERSLSLGSDTLFEFDRHDLSPSGKAAVAALGTIIAEHQPQSVTITGHTDSKGSDDYNITLSKQRAQTVAAALREAGSLPRSVTVLGLGEKSPVAPNESPDGKDDPAGRAKNRRVEVLLVACESKAG